MTTLRQQAYQLASDHGMTIDENHEGRGVTINIEAPRGRNFGGDHQLAIHFYSGSPWREVIDTIKDSVTVACHADSCGAWYDGRCEYWAGEVEAVKA